MWSPYTYFMALLELEKFHMKFFRRLPMKMSKPVDTSLVSVPTVSFTS